MSDHDDDGDLYTCPVCGGMTMLLDSPLAELADEFAGYAQCMECGVSSDESGFTPVEPGGA